jgi:hypothetical protein
MSWRLAAGWVAMSERDVQRIRVLSEVLSGRIAGSAFAVRFVACNRVRITHARLAIVPLRGHQVRSLAVIEGFLSL